MQTSLVIVGLAIAGCGADSNQITFHGEQPLLPDFAFDTGLQPTGSPVQLQLTFSAGGAITADASAVAGLDGSTAVVAGVPGSGKFSLDGHVKLAGMLHVDVSGLSYDGPIPGIENVDVAFTGTTMFDPFLLDTTTTLTTMLPQIDFPAIPLPGGLPGTLQISIAAGSTLESVLAGDCAGVVDSSVQFLADTTTSGNLVVDSKIVLKVPVLGDKTFNIPSVTVAIPATTKAMDLGTASFSASGPKPAGSSLATTGACDDDGSGGGGGGGGGGHGGQTCTASTDGYTPVYHPPFGLHANQCGDNQLTAFNAACLASGGTKAACDDFIAGNLTCASCLISPPSNPGYGAFIRYPEFTVLNVGGCIALRLPAQLACAQTIEAYYDCVGDACSGCAGSPSAETQACETAADAGRCNAYSQPDQDCLNNLSSTAPECFSFDSVARLFCGP